MKSYKREVGGAVLLVAAAISYRFWTLDDPALVAAYSGAWGTGVVGLVFAGLAPFGIHHIWEKKDDA